MTDIKALIARLRSRRSPIRERGVFMPDIDCEEAADALEAAEAKLAELWKVNEWERRQRCRAEARVKELERALEEFECRTRALPHGHEDETKGASTYNWRMSCLREIRELAALSPAPAQEDK